MLPLETKTKAKVLDNKGVAHGSLVKAVCHQRKDKDRGAKGEQFFAFETEVDYHQDTATAALVMEHSAGMSQQLNENKPHSPVDAIQHLDLNEIDPDPYPIVDLGVVLRHPVGLGLAKTIDCKDDSIRKAHPTSLELPTSSTVTASNSNKLDMLELGLEQPTLVIQSPKSPKTPTLSRKLKAISLDSEPSKSKALDIARDVFSMPNTPKKHTNSFHGRDIFEVADTSGTSARGMSLGGGLGLGGLGQTNLKRFASNTSISGSQTLKTLPEIMMLQDFSSENRVEPVRIKAKGLLERRGSNASLTIDLGAAEKTEKIQVVPAKQNQRLNSAKSISTLNLTTFGTCFTSFYQNVYKCEHCVRRSCDKANSSKVKDVERKKETCGNCTIYESVPSKFCYDARKDLRQKDVNKKCHCICNVLMCGKKSLSNENLYVPPCSLCLNGNDDTDKNRYNGAGAGCGGHGMHCRGHRRACYPRQADLEASQSLSDDFKMHLQNVQYLQTAGSVLSIAELKACCELPRVPKLHQEFWEVPLNLQEKCIVSGSQTRNRYRGVLPNEHSRVHLDHAQSYIHANFIKGPDYTESAYIATQGPMAHTCDDFWQMVWQTDCDCIVMLTQLVEKRRNKCELYFPLGTTTNSTNSSTIKNTPTPSTSKTKLTNQQRQQSKKVTYYAIKSTITQQNQQQEKFTFGHTHTCSTTSSNKMKAANNNNNSTSNNHRYAKTKQFDFDDDIIEYEELEEVQHGIFRITFVNVTILGDYSMRTLKLSNVETHESKMIRHYWYPNWQDHKMAEPEQVLRLALNVLEYIESKKCQKQETKISASNTKLNEHSNTNMRDLDIKLDQLDTNNEKVIENVDIINQLGSVKVNIENVRDQHEKTPLIVHCSAGIGRTGCFLAIINGIQQLRTNSNVDVLAILCSLRLHRGGMVQTAEQYELIHRVLGIYAEQMSHQQHQQQQKNC